MKKPCIAQRRRDAEKSKPKILLHYRAKNLLNLRASNAFWFNPAQRETIHGFLCASAPLRENMLLRHSKISKLGPEDQDFKD